MACTRRLTLCGPTLARRDRERDFANNSFVINATKDIKAGDELLHVYKSKGWRKWEAMMLARERARRSLAHFAGQGLVKALGSWEDYVAMRQNMRRAGAAHLRLLAARVEQRL